MKLTTTTRYGLMALSDLCAHSETEPVCVNEVASRQNIPVNYLERIFAKLRRAEILTSVRGAQGGFKLAKPAEKITISEIMNALGENVIFGNCQTENGCENANLCPTFELWRRVKNSIDEILNTTTLADLFNTKIALLEKNFIDPERQNVREKALLNKKIQEGIK